MKSKDGFVQAYNVQIAVDAQAQIIVAHDVTQSGSDCAHLLPMTDAVEANLGRKPEQVSADAGYCSQENLAGLDRQAGRFSEAESAYRRALQIAELVHGKDHAETASTLGNLALLYADLGRHGEAAKCRREVRQLIRTQALNVRLL